MRRGSGRLGVSAAAPRPQHREQPTGLRDAREGLATPGSVRESGWFDLEDAVQRPVDEPPNELERHDREGRHYSCRLSCGGSVVLVDEATEAVAAVDLAHMRSFLWLVRVGRAKFKGTMRSLAVVCGRRRHGARFRGGVG